MKEQSIRQKTADLAMLCDEGENFSEDINALVVIADKLAKKEIERANKHIKRCSALLVSIIMQTETVIHH